MATAKSDPTVYASKPPSDYHKWFARWIVSEVGYDPDSAASKKAAFLRGVSIATAARPAFMDSDYLEEMRDKHGVAKRGPKPRELDEEEEAPKRRGRPPAKKAAPAKKAVRRKPEPEPEEEEFEDEFDEDESEEEFEDDDSDEEFDDEDEEFEEEEEAPPPRKRTAARKATPAKRAPAKKAAPARRKPAEDDDEFLF